MEKAYIFLAEGFEEIEALTVVDILRRAGIAIDMISVTGTLEVTGSHGIRVQADRRFEEDGFSDASILILPGGMPGTKHLEEHEDLCALLKQAKAEGKKLAAICAAPRVLGALGLLQGERAVCYPGNEDRLTGAQVTENPVEVSGQITTSRGMGTAIPFALKLTEQLAGPEKAEQIGKAIIYL